MNSYCKRKMADWDDIKKTPEDSLDEAMLALCKSVDAKRARTVIDHILNHGIISNEELSDLYGYDHPPRAIRDVRENGIPLVTHRVTSPKTGRRVGAANNVMAADPAKGSYKVFTGPANKLQIRGASALLLPW